jgi:hypothetical protein
LRDVGRSAGRSFGLGLVGDDSSSLKVAAGTPPSGSSVFIVAYGGEYYAFVVLGMVVRKAV